MTNSQKKSIAIAGFSPEHTKDELSTNRNALFKGLILIRSRQTFSFYRDLVYLEDRKLTFKINQLLH